MLRSHRVNHESFIERLFESLVSGDRDGSRRVVDEARAQGATAEEILSEILWPTYESVEKLHRSHQIEALSHHFATRLLRMLVDQVGQNLQRQAIRGRRVFAACGPNEADELAAQIAVDMLESHGFSMSFCGGGIASDELLEHIQKTQPDVLLMFASAPSDLPEIRGLIDTINEIGAVRKLQIVVGGGVFNRAEGLAAEIGADLWASTPRELVSAMINEPQRRAAATQHSVGKKRKVRAAA